MNTINIDCVIDECKGGKLMYTLKFINGEPLMTFGIETKYGREEQESVKYDYINKRWLTKYNITHHQFPDETELNILNPLNNNDNELDKMII